MEDFTRKSAIYHTEKEKISTYIHRRKKTYNKPNSNRLSLIIYTK